MKRILIATLALALVVPSGQVLAQSGSNSPQYYPTAEFPQNGGRLGVTVEVEPYHLNGNSYLKVMEVDPASDLYGRIHVGDFIYNMNGYSIRSTEDFRKVVGSGSPGTTLNVSYLDASNGNRRTSAVATLLDANYRPVQSKSSKIVSTEQNQSSNTPWCLQGSAELTLCALGALAAATIGAAILSSGSNSSGSSTSQDSNDNPNDAISRPRAVAKSKPKPDTSVGCAWGDRAYNTCH